MYGAHIRNSVDISRIIPVCMLSRASVGGSRLARQIYHRHLRVGNKFMSSKYASLSREDLENRLAVYEAQSTTINGTANQSHLSTTESIAGPSRALGQTHRPAASTSSIRPGRKLKQAKPAKAFNFYSYPTRHIALLLSYHGWPYSGLAIQSLCQDDYPTVEGELLRALEKAKLIEGGQGWDGCEFSRCGRTDRGVSGAGQVVNLWVRSTRRKEAVSGPDDSWREARNPPMPKIPEAHGEEVAAASAGDVAMDTNGVNGNGVDVRPVVKTSIELPYVKILNSHLPPSIRILAWSPVSPSFDSRFSCSFRHYKYAFHRSPSPGVPPLDLDQMRAAADLLIGEHDFRNFCKLDGSKQIENHSRRVLKAYFDEAEAGTEGMVVFNLIGTAFLWHQVRHILAVLFLVGARLERPEVINELLDAENMPRRPLYMMAQALPLRLHECGYKDGELDWRTGSYDGYMDTITEAEADEERTARIKVEKELDAARQDSEIRTWQISSALGRFGEVFGTSALSKRENASSEKMVYPLGGGEMVEGRKYKPLKELPQGDLVEDVNRRWREGKGKTRMSRIYGEADE